jgi:hypothetical protein
MMNYIKSHKVALLIAGIIVFSVVKFAAEFYSGYLAAPFWVMALFSTEPIRYILIAICVIVIITIKELNKKRKVLIFIALALLLAIGLIPDGHFVTLGALRSIDNANPEQFRDDAREMLNDYEPDTLFSDSPRRNLDQVQLPRNKIPPSILRANIGDAFILEKYMLIEKFGLGGSFRGFIVFREGEDIWKNDDSITRLEGCSYCWKIRITDGLYWYHAAPVEEENARLDFLSK